MNKKLLSLILALTVATSFGACMVLPGGSASDSSVDSSVTENSSVSDLNGSSSSNDEETETVDYSTYDSYWMKQFDHKTMTIGAYNASPNGGYEYADNYASYESLATLADCGINTVYALYERLGGAKADVLNILDACERLGLSYMASVLSGYSQTNKLALSSALNGITDSPALGGFMICDEPGYTMYSTIAKSVGNYSALAPDLLYHTNLFPDYANAKQLYYKTYTNSDALPEGGYTYEQYVDDYLEICNPQILSYDSYPFRGAFPGVLSGYFDNLSLIRSKAAGAGIPFWIFIQCYGNGGGTREPVGAEMLWQVNTGLSFGSKGIQYFCYYLPAQVGETFTGCLVDYNGQKTALWNWAQKANKQIAAVDEVLMCSLNKGVMQVGTTPCEIPAGDLLTSYGRLTGASGEHSIVGCFDYKGKEAFYVTNNALDEDETVTLNFNASVSGKSVVNATEKAFSGRSVTLTLAAGEGALVVLE